MEANVRKMTALYMFVSGIAILLMMVLGLLMLLAQGKMIPLGQDTFYEMMTAHGTFMVGAAAFAASAVMWYFLRQYVRLSFPIFVTHFVLFLTGAVMTAISIFVFRFAGAWTFLYPLPAMSAGMWGKTGASLYLIGMLLIGVSFLLLYLDTSRAIIREYGSLGHGLGWPQILGKVKGYGPPPTVVASTMVSIVNLVSLTVGASVLVMSLINLFQPSIEMDPLLAKNLIYAFGHIFANSVIYMGVIAVYEILPKYTNRPWKSYKIFLIAWNMSTLFTIIVYPHHLLMDFVMPKWMLIIGQVFSYLNGLPVLVVTAFGALMIVYCSGIEWDRASSFIFLSMFGWVAGVIPAIADATIVINHVMHNTKWVPGHFHMYMGVGAVSMLFGFMYYFIRGNERKIGYADMVSFWVYTVFFLSLCGTFLLSGKVSAPRRWAVHFPEWVPYDRMGAVFAVVIIAAVTVFLYRFFVSVIIVQAKQNIEVGPRA
ncbi:cbb3-type cytochrome c oxidase subunit I [Geobacillus thermodenitrificans]|uniref:cbb3-type cytochrome c oxidase subunit I n=1 Tax=Geobacillus thermodenitrificans TaxID=33940 RepID=UPI002E23B0FA|nr:cbb3-type cytochrome c oxidase subunit I [Geobacillus thermodenitrificans]MED3716858.1 cbb3-type cytochrome c oxidase subunit I [Geobacillus thermodenitrificans]MED4916133.1 cbb3-type cytochrome c oxidase subunit I [Geobacillus thermodenitrificans]